MQWEIIEGFTKTADKIIYIFEKKFLWLLCRRNVYDGTRIEAERPLIRLILLVTQVTDDE